jgi:hypothetical protein
MRENLDAILQNTTIFLQQEYPRNEPFDLSWQEEGIDEHGNFPPPPKWGRILMRKYEHQQCDMVEMSDGNKRLIIYAIRPLQWKATTRFITDHWNIFTSIAPSPPGLPYQLTVIDDEAGNRQRQLVFARRVITDLYVDAQDRETFKAYWVEENGRNGVDSQTATIKRYLQQPAPVQVDTVHSYVQYAHTFTRTKTDKLDEPWITISSRDKLYATAFENKGGHIIIVRWPGHEVAYFTRRFTQQYFWTLILNTILNLPMFNKAVEQHPFTVKTHTYVFGDLHDSNARILRHRICQHNCGIVLRHTC